MAPPQDFDYLTKSKAWQKHILKSRPPCPQINPSWQIYRKIKSPDNSMRHTSRNKFMSKGTFKTISEEDQKLVSRLWASGSWFSQRECESWPWHHRPWEGSPASRHDQSVNFSHFWVHLWKQLLLEDLAYLLAIELHFLEAKPFDKMPLRLLYRDNLIEVHYCL